MCNAMVPLYVIPLFGYASLRSLITVAYFVLVLSTVGVIIHEKRDPVRALGWIAMISLLPVAGIVFYVFFGRNHRKEKIFNRKELHDVEQLDALCLRQQNALGNAHMLQQGISDNRDIIMLLLNSNKAPLTMHNRVKVLRNGRETFSAIMEAIREARSSIHLEYYIFEYDRIGRKIVRLLCEKARSGVEVRLIYDDVGSWHLKRRHVEKMRRAGVDVRCFMPVLMPYLTSKLNYRNHRKIVVTDGRTAFTGGINIADRYLTGNRLGKWRDTHLRVEGEAVAMLQAVFVTDWYFVSDKELLHSDKYFPKSRIADVFPMQIASSGPDSDWASIMQAFFAAISKAQKYIYISSPYFVPNQAVLTALKVAALSGIDVKVMIPARSDSKLVYWATRSYIGELLEAGISVCLYTGGFNHSKVIVIDDSFSSVGTANMDMRSFEDNFEVSAIMYDRSVACTLRDMFLADLEKCTCLTPEVWEGRPAVKSAYESLARLLSPLL